MSNITIQGTTNLFGIEVPNIYGGFGAGRKVMLVNTIAGIHGREVKVINQNINRNRDKFIDGIHILDIKNSVTLSDPLLEAGVMSKQSIANSENIYALSERGYVRLLKIMNDETAWKKWDIIETDYFSMSEQRENLQIYHEQIKKSLMDYDPMAYAVYLSTFLPVNSPELLEVNKQITWREDLNANSLQCYVGFNSHKVGYICVEEMAKQYAIDERHCFYLLRGDSLIEDIYIGHNPRNHLSIFETRLTQRGREAGGEEVKHTKKQKDKAGGQVYAFRFPELKFLEKHGVWLTVSDFELNEYLRIANSKIEDCNRSVLTALNLAESYNEVRKISRKSVFNSRQEREEYEKKYSSRKR